MIFFCPLNELPSAEQLNGMEPCENVDSLCEKYHMF